MNSHPKLRLVQDFICEILRDWPNVVELVSNPFVNLLIDNFINVISLWMSKLSKKMKWTNGMKEKTLNQGKTSFNKKIVNQSHLKVLTTRNGLLVASVKKISFWFYNVTTNIFIQIKSMFFYPLRIKMNSMLNYTCVGGLCEIGI